MKERHNKVEDMRLKRGLDISLHLCDNKKDLDTQPVGRGTREREKKNKKAAEARRRS
jgi:hypothetical protein